MSLQEPETVPQDTNTATEKGAPETRSKRLTTPGFKLLIIAGVFCVVLFTSCIIAGIVVALLRNDLTNAVSDYALKHVLIPLLGVFCGSVVFFMIAYFRYRKLNSKHRDNEGGEDLEETGNSENREDVP